MTSAPESQVELFRDKIATVRGAHGGLVIRIPRVAARDLLFTWNAWKQLLSRTDLDEWLLGHLNMKVSEVQVLADNGLGGNGMCPIHRYQHLQVFPIDGQPMTCQEAWLKEQSKE